MEQVRTLLGPVYDSVKRAPVELRNADAVLLGRATVSTLEQGIGRHLPQGAYTATVVLPRGESLSEAVPVDIAGEMDLSELANRLRTSALRTGPTAPASPVGAGTPALPELEAMGAGAGPATAPAPVLYFSLFNGSLDSARPVAPAAVAASGARFSLQGGTATVINTNRDCMTLQIRQPAQPVLNIVVPPGCRVTVSRPACARKRPPIEMMFDLAIVDELIDLRTRGSLTEATAAASTLKLSDVVAIAVQHPAAAVAAAYIMMRTGIYEEASKSIKALMNCVDIGPDLLILRAELYARMARYAKAQEGFLAAAHFGVPMASTGLAYLVDRLRFLAQTRHGRGAGDGAPGQPGSKHRTQLQQSLVAAQRIASRCDFGLIFTNYTGVSPGTPGDEVWQAGTPDSAMAIF